MEKDTFSTPF